MIMNSVRVILFVMIQNIDVYNQKLPIDFLTTCFLWYTLCNLLVY